MSYIVIYGAYATSCTSLMLLVRLEPLNSASNLLSLMCWSTARIVSSRIRSRKALSPRNSIGDAQLLPIQNCGSWNHKSSYLVDGRTVQCAIHICRLGTDAETYRILLLRFLAYTLAVMSVVSIRIADSRWCRAIVNGAVLTNRLYLRNCHRILCLAALHADCRSDICGVIGLVGTYHAASSVSVVRIG